MQYVQRILLFRFPSPHAFVMHFVGLEVLDSFFSPHNFGWLTLWPFSFSLSPSCVVAGWFNNFESHCNLKDFSHIVDGLFAESFYCFSFFRFGIELMAIMVQS
jgi:hypothetical protein